MKIKKWSVFGILILSVFLDVSSSYGGAPDDDYNFSWLDPDKKIYVLQNRRFKKTGSPEIYLMGGASLEDTYRNVYQVQPRLGFWFSEEFGIETFYAAKFNSINNAYRALDEAINQNASDVTKTPYIREVTSDIGILFNWAPWYAKINVFNSILYFDWYFSAGIGSLTTRVGPGDYNDALYKSYWQSENLFAVFLGTGQIFHLSDHWKIRLDVLGHFYSAPIYGGAPGAPTNSAIFSNFDVNVGIGFKL